MDFSPERLQASVQAMKANYPSFSMGGLPIGTGPEAVWKGWIQPIRRRENLNLLLSDLSNDNPVRVLPGGEVIHSPDCSHEHSSLPWLKQLKKPDSAYRLKVAYGGKRHPRAFVIDPILVRKNTRHTFLSGAICAYPPWRDVWEWQRNDVADFMDHAVIWLIKHTVWQQTDIWLGDEMRHDQIFLYNNVGPSQQCWCGSGDLYGKCHRQPDNFSMPYGLGFRH